MSEAHDPQRVTRATYDRIAPKFLARTRRREVLRDEFTAFADALDPGALVLDVGAGPGFDSLKLAELGFRPLASDLSRGMLEVGRDEFPVPRLQCDMRCLPVGTAVLDGIWANASLLHLTRADASVALDEFRRVLRPGGVLHLSVKAGSTEGFETEPYDVPRWFTRWTAGSLDERIAAAGFQIASAHLRERAHDDWHVRLARRAGETDDAV